MVDYAARPLQLHGCWSTWAEQDEATVIRTQMDSGFVKVRRRFTGTYRLAEASVVYKKDYYNFFMEWFRLDCQAGVLPTNIIEPTGVESVWRFMEPPQISWTAVNAFTAQCKLERLPGWQEI